MKIKEWIILGLLISVAASSRGLCENRDNVKETLTKETFVENLERIEAALQNMQPRRRDVAASDSSWNQIKDFQAHLWRAMALDPGPGTNVPVSQVPKHLFAAELNIDLVNKLEALRRSTVPSTFHAQAEFNEYLKVVEQIISMRRTRSFPAARAIAKRGTLETAYNALAKRVNPSVDPLDDAVDSNDVTHLLSTIQAMKAYVAATPKEAQKKDVFANGNQFVWYTVAAILGFFIGIAGFRMNPDLFKKFLSEVQAHPIHAAIASAANANPQPEVKRLDYSMWLKEFEEILTRLKTSQLTHERRIGDMVQNSEKISQQALSLYADARIKNEANLEYRMSGLLREVQQQFEQGQRLQAGDRIQVNLILEHCVRLCDAIEGNAVQLERHRLSETPSRQIG